MPAFRLGAHSWSQLLEKWCSSGASTLVDGWYAPSVPVFRAFVLAHECFRHLLIDQSSSTQSAVDSSKYC